MVDYGFMERCDALHRPGGWSPPFNRPRADDSYQTLKRPGVVRSADRLGRSSPMFFLSLGPRASADLQRCAPSAFSGLKAAA